MENLLDKLIADQELDNYYSLETEEQDKLRKEIAEFADNHPEEIKEFCHKIIPSEFSVLEVIYEALGENPEKWGMFLYEEIKRIFNTAKNISKPYKYTTCLEFYVDSFHNLPFIDKIIQFLSQELDNPNDALRHRALDLLGTWVNEENYKKHRITLDKMESMINDSNWKIRYLTNLTLADCYDIPKERVKLKFFDMLRGKSIFFDPFSFNEGED